MDTQSLIEAAETGATDVVDKLLKSGVNVNARPSNGTTALIRAASNNHVETVRLLIANGADINAARSDGMTALILAAFFGHTETAAALLEKGADLKARDQLGSTALDWALSRGYTETFEFLKNASLGKAEVPVASLSAEIIAATTNPEQIRDKPIQITESLLSENSDDVLDLGEAAASAPPMLSAQVDDPIELNLWSDAQVSSDVESLDDDETTIISPSFPPKVAASAIPYTVPVVRRRAAPPSRSNVWLLAFTWFVVFSFCAALTYAFTQGSSLVRRTTGSAPMNSPAPSASTQTTYPPAVLPTQNDNEQRAGQSATPSVLTTPERPTTTQPVVSEANTHERKTKPQTESLPTVESVQTAAPTNESQEEAARPAA
ncbi:MAG: ankyrin repeat domain-containing protein, partial [Pyrinomonadaceae bacterium]|nr:ankyrin repeat domain-containing protein [Pyrinomonadaceae bacterium]